MTNNINTPVTDDEMDTLATAFAAGDFQFTDGPVDVIPPRHDGTEIMAVYSVRLPADTAQQLGKLAATKGVKPSTLMREMVEAAIAAEQDDEPISLTDAIRALSTLRKKAA